jgi:hypothetical protein
MVILWLMFDSKRIDFSASVPLNGNTLALIGLSVIAFHDTKLPPMPSLTLTDRSIFILWRKLPAAIPLKQAITKTFK